MARSLAGDRAALVLRQNNELTAPGRSTRLAGADTAHDRFHVEGREVHWLIGGKMTDSSITLPKLAKLIGSNAARNINSLTRLADRL